MAEIVHNLRRPRLLIVAHSCSPYHGSERGVGWNRAREAAKYCDTWVICEDRMCGDDIRRYERLNGPTPGLKFVGVPRSACEQLLTRVPGCYYLSYNLWQRRASRVGSELHRTVGFDLAHQSTLCGYREPGYVARLGIPVVWGPIGGTQNYPWRFLRLAGVKGAVSETLRSVANWLQLRTSRRVRRAARSVTALVAANHGVARAMRQVHGVQPEVLSDVGIERVSGTARIARNDRPLRLLWTGNLHPFKAFPVLLRSLKLIKAEVPFELRVLGEGPCRAVWQKLAKSLGIDDRIAWLGQLPHAEALQQYDWADVFAFTSLRDTTGTVVVEALSAGLPIVAFDHQGVADVVTDECGIKVAVDNPASAIKGFAAAIRELASDAVRREQLSQGALERANEYLWSRHGRNMATIYYRMVGRTLTDHLEPRITPEGSCSEPWDGACLSAAVGGAR